MNNKKHLAVLSTAALSTMLVGALATNVHAADRDVTNVTKQVQYLAEKYSVDPAEFNKLLLDLAGTDEFSYEYKSIELDFNKLDSFIAAEKKADPKMSVTQILEKAKDDPNIIMPVKQDVKVSSISAINGTEVTVKLEAKPAKTLTGKDFSVKDSNGVTYTVTTASATDDTTYKLTLDKAVAGKGTLTVNKATLDFNTVEVGYKFTATIDKAELTADGKDNAVITYTATKDGVVDTAFKGTVKVISTKGASFAKDVIAFDKGVAKIQLNALSSQSDINDTILAILQDTDDAKLNGKSLDSVAVTYKAVTGPGTSVGIQAVYAQANDAANVIVKFNKDVDIAAVRKNLDNVVIYRNANDSTGVKPMDAFVGDDTKTVRFVLAEGNALTDNNTITVKILQKDGVFYGATQVFNLQDGKAPQAVAVTTPDYKTLVAEFTEPVASGIVETPANWVINGHQLVGGDIAFIKAGKSIGTEALNDNNVDSEGNAQISVYDVTNHIDNRNFVTIRLKNSAVAKYQADGKTLNTAFLYRDGGNLLQASNVTDFAGKTDLSGQNVAQTQEFTFTTPAAPAAPIVQNVAMDSPEQFRVKFNDKLSDGLTLTNADILVSYVSNVDTNGTPTYSYLTNNGSATGTKLYTVTKNPKDSSDYIIHLTQDWTKTYNTSSSKINYYTPGYNNVVISVLKANVKNFVDVQMADNYNYYTSSADFASKASKVTMSLDAAVPTAVAEQTKSAAGKAQKSVTVTLSEPVQVNTDAYRNTITPSQQQDAKGVPVPTFQFVSEDLKTTMDATVSSVSADNKSFVLDAANLPDGKWTLFVRSISDDVGNTSATLTCPFEYTTSTTVVDTKPYIVSAYAADDKAGNDIVKIQYSVNMGVDALRTQYYTINAKSLPEGTNVTAVDNNVYGAGKGTLVTITLPSTFLTDTPHHADGLFDAEGVLTVSNSLKDAAGNIITGITQVKTPYNSTVTNGGNTIIVTNGDTLTGYNNPNGTVIVDAGDNGDATLNNVVAKEIVVLSGGQNSIHLNGVTATTVTVKNDNSVSLKLDPTTSITTLDAQASVNVQGLGRITTLKSQTNGVTLTNGAAAGTIQVTSANAVPRINGALPAAVTLLKADGTVDASKTNVAPGALGTIDVTAPVVKEVKIGDKTFAPDNNKNINISSLTVGTNGKIKIGTPTLTLDTNVTDKNDSFDNVKATVTLGVPVAGLPTYTDNLGNMVTLLNGLDGDKDGEITPANLAKLNHATVSLADANGNTATYTLITQ